MDLLLKHYDTYLKLQQNHYYERTHIQPLTFGLKFSYLYPTLILTVELNHLEPHHQFLDLVLNF